MDTTQQQKKKMRVQLQKKRAALAKDFVAHESVSITTRALQLKSVQDAQIIFIYISTGNEVATHDLITTLLMQGKIICVPKVITAEKMIAVRIFDMDHLVKNQQGIVEPKSMEEFSPDSDLCILPALAYDTKGNRLGMGGGYYDRFLAVHKKMHTLGIIFDQFLVHTLPSDVHDQSVQEILSQQRHVCGLR